MRQSRWSSGHTRYGDGGSQHSLAGRESKKGGRRAGQEEEEEERVPLKGE